MDRNQLSPVSGRWLTEHGSKTRTALPQSSSPAPFLAATASNTTPHQRLRARARTPPPPPDHRTVMPMPVADPGSLAVALRVHSLYCCRTARFILMCERSQPLSAGWGEWFRWRESFAAGTSVTPSPRPVPTDGVNWRRGKVMRTIQSRELRAGFPTKSIPCTGPRSPV